MAGKIRNIEPPKAHTEREDSVSWYQPLLFNFPSRTFFRSKTLTLRYISFNFHLLPFTAFFFFGKKTQFLLKIFLTSYTYHFPVNVIHYKGARIIFQKQFLFAGILNGYYCIPYIRAKYSFSTVKIVKWAVRAKYLTMAKYKKNICNLVSNLLDKRMGETSLFI